MPRRQRWTPVKGTANRVYEARERLALGVLDLGGRLALGLPGWWARRRAGRPEPGALREVLVLRLDRIGDLVMSLPALHELRAALPQARIRLAVGRWSLPLARRAPVDEVLEWSAPWVGRRQEGAHSWRELAARAREAGRAGVDLALDLQGDVRASALLWLTGATHRVGYANTGGAYLLTRTVELDETVSWVEQNRRAVQTALGAPPPAAPAPELLDAEERAFAHRLLENLAARAARPLVAIHPSGGRRVKEWDVGRWAELAGRLQRDFGASVLITGSAADRPLAERLSRALPRPALDFTGRLDLRESLALIAAVDLFLSPDTGPMHMACAVGTPSVSVFGPSDPGRYFSGGSGRPGTRHVVVRAELWCSPCNLIRRPPAECDRGEPPECLRLVGVEDVHREAVRLLREVGGYEPAAA